MSDWSFYDRGLSLFPLTYRTKSPALRWEIYQTQRAAPEQVAGWRQHQWNTGVATGAVSGVVVLDCDDMLARLDAETRGIPRTLTVATPRGTHFYFRHPGWDCPNRAGPVWCERDTPGMDLRGDGGYVVGPGSYYVPTEAERAKGKVEGPYLVELDAPIADAPDWLLALIFPKQHKPAVPAKTAETTSAYGRAALHDEVRRIIEAPDGAVNDTVNSSAFAVGQLVAGGEIEHQEGWGALWEALETKGIADDGKAPGTLDRGFAAGMLVPRAGEHGDSLTPEQKLGTRSPVSSRDGVAVERDAATLIPPPPPSAVTMVGFGPAQIPQYCGGMQAVDYFEGCVYVARRDEMFIPSGVLLNKSAFDGIYGGPEFVMDIANSKKVRSAWQFFRENSQVPMPKAWDICFRPELPSGAQVMIGGLPYVNTYAPIETPRKVGDPAPFLDHVRRLLPVGDDADYLLHWMASAVRNPGAKFQWWPVIQGTKGNGKTLLLTCMMEAVGERYCHLVRADSVMKTGNQFNDWIERKLFLGFEEIRTSEGRRDFTEMMKDSVTNRRLGTEGKNKGQGTADNRANGMMLTNHDDAMPVDDDERRWGIFYTAQQSAADLARDGMTGDYFPKLYHWLREQDGHAIVTEFLHTMPLRADMDPARGLQRAPTTSSTAAAIRNSLGPLEQELQEAIDGELPGFRGGVITSVAIRGLFDRLRKNVGPKRYKSIMEAIGYHRHPILGGQKGRPNNPIFDGSKPVLYFERGSQLLAEKDYWALMQGVDEILRGGQPAASNVVPFNPRR